MNDWIVTWAGGSARGFTETQAENLERVLARMGIDATRRRALSPVDELRAKVRVPDDEQLVRQVREEQG